MSTAVVVLDAASTAYDFAPDHPMQPARLVLLEELSRRLGVLGRPGVEVLPARVADDQEILTVHDSDFVRVVRAASDPTTRPVLPKLLAYGIGGDDVPAFDGMHEAAARLAGGTLEAVEAVVAGRAPRAVHAAGGMHHARASQAAGFCVYNDAAIGIRRALDRGVRRVLYVDLDAHHGDGVERTFWDDPRVVTFSIHETGEVLFPGTGFVQDLGGAGALGTAVNLPLPPRTGGEGWLRALQAVLPVLARAMRPELIVSQHGADAHRDDPLADLALTLEAQREAALLVRDLADELCEGRWVAVGGGGYAITDVVPRAWTHLLAIVTGDPLPANGPLPQDWTQVATRIAREHGLPDPRHQTTLGDHHELAVRDWSRGYDPEDPLDRAVQACRRSVFPEWGLDPFYD
ncbi:acetoin utilization protein AcuC [Brachybacterium sp. EF45031]|uniref:acetoin utilization protein AcuC n=1 Tax=Brachybacterium sillae TaxID=2810536 RepID=UPI00217CCB5D|nr:acetoin utilization protein AcuC [Brachybacterium sillae]MCS6711320.1 acetoin utilization protein AcuC [Brachybacterium sillae]